MQALKLFWFHLSNHLEQPWTLNFHDFHMNLPTTRTLPSSSWKKLCAATVLSSRLHTTISHLQNKLDCLPMLVVGDDEVFLQAAASSGGVTPAPYRPLQRCICRLYAVRPSIFCACLFIVASWASFSVCNALIFQILRCWDCLSASFSFAACASVGVSHHSMP